MPTSWSPLVPLLRPEGMCFELGTLVPVDATAPPGPLGRLLAELGVRIPEEEILRYDTEVRRAWQYIRWTDGTQHAWMGRLRRPSPPRGDSGLRFDVLIPDPGQLG